MGNGRTKKAHTGEEAIYKRIEALEAEVQTLKGRVQTMEDIEEIYKLQRIYGYYLDNEFYDKIVDLFAESTESVEIGARGVYLGKKGAEHRVSTRPAAHGSRAVPVELFRTSSL
jgi:hypothetical protein